MRERIQKILSARGVASRRQAEQMLCDGRISVNGSIASLGDSADPLEDIILVDGERLPAAEGYVYILLNKPRGYVTTLSDEKGRPTAASLVCDCGVRVYPIGRLDMDSEGLLLFTNDGAFANALMHPKQQVDKTYFVKVRGYHEAATALLSRAITLDGYQIRPPKVKLLGSEGNLARYLVTIHEGRNRQVRRMCQAAGLDVITLRRIGEGKLKLGELPLGKWRYLDKQEIDILKKDAGQ